jgi:transcriptional repressor NrdR
MVTKRNGGRELFNSDKLMSSLAIAFEKVPIEEAVLTSLAEEIESGLQGRSNRDVSSLEIGQLVLEHLKNLNQVAYIRFASVYHQSQTLQDVIDILDGLQASERTDNGAANPSYPSPQTEADASNRSPASIPS